MRSICLTTYLSTYKCIGTTVIIVIVNDIATAADRSEVTAVTIDL